MKRIIKFIFHPNFLPLLFVFFAGVLAARSLIFENGYFIMHDDLQMMRQLEMEKCFIDGQIPCRWVPDMGYGYGFPLFNFYPPLPYLVGELFRLIGLSFITTVKLTFALSLIASGITMYFFAREYFGKIGAVLSGVFYIWVPYHSVDIYVRGAMNESWAFVWFPLILWSAYKIIRHDDGKLKYIVFLALAWFGLLTSHNLMVMIFAPVFALWCLFTIFYFQAWKKLPFLLVGSFWALGLAAFFTIPAIMENKYTALSTIFQDFYDFRAHFVTINQLLITRFWGYGPSAWGTENDDMPFQIGHLHWILSIVVTLLILLKMLNTKGSFWQKIKSEYPLVLTIYFIAIGWIAAALTHSRSTPIWLLISPLKYLQFPWRFLTLTAFTFSFVVGILPQLLVIPILKNGDFQKFLSIPQKLLWTNILVITVVIFNWNYFLPLNGKMGSLTDTEKFSGAAWDLQRAAGILDYLPLDAKMAPVEGPKSVADIVDGSANVINPTSGTYWTKFIVDVQSPEAEIRLNIFKFPNWQIRVDGNEITSYIPKEEVLGRMYFSLDQGSHEIYAQFLNTPVRTISNIISVIAWGILLIIPFRKKFIKNI